MKPYSGVIYGLVHQYVQRMNTHMFGTKSSPRVGLVKLVPVTARFEGPTWDNLASYHVNQKGSWRWYEFPLWLGKSYAKVPLHVQIPIKMVCFQTFLVASIFDLNIASHAAISK